jgi:hypothetical protein
MNVAAYASGRRKGAREELSTAKHPRLVYAPVVRKNFIPSLHPCCRKWKSSYW